MLNGPKRILISVSVCRYLGIVHPMRVMGKITSRHSVAISFLVWLLVIIQILPDMFYDKNHLNSSDSCFDTTADHLVHSYMPYSIGWTVTGFAIPLVIISACYGHVIYVLATNANVNPLLRQRCLKLVVILVLLFSICFIPYHVFRNLNLNSRISKLEGVCCPSFNDIYIAHQVSRGLVCLNSALNPLIYLVGNDDFLMKVHHFSSRARRSLAGLTGTVLYRKTVEADVELIRNRFTADQFP